jgi:hypothetical protein
MSETETPMMNTVTIQIMVVTMHEDKLWQRSLTLPTGATIEHSLSVSGYFRDFPTRSIEQLSIGIFGSTFQFLLFWAFSFYWVKTVIECDNPTSKQAS